MPDTRTELCLKLCKDMTEDQIKHVTLLFENYHTNIDDYIQLNIKQAREYQTLLNTAESIMQNMLVKLEKSVTIFESVLKLTTQTLDDGSLNSEIVTKIRETIIMLLKEQENG